MSGIITKPVFWVIMVAMWALVFPLIMGAYNGIYLNTVSSGTTTSERFDRVMPKGTNTASQDAWEAKTAVVDFTASAAGTAVTAVVTSAYILGGDSGKCHVGDLAKTGVTPFEAYTPSGNSVNVTADGKVVGCQYEERSPIFGVFNGFVRVLMQMIALAGPLGFMLALAYFGTMLIGTATGHPVLRVVMVVILVLIGAILVNIVLPYSLALHRGRLPGYRRRQVYRAGPGIGPHRRPAPELLRRDLRVRDHRLSLVHHRPDTRLRHQRRILPGQRDVACGSSSQYSCSG